MAPGKDSVTDESIWKAALERSFLLPPRQWIFQDNAISFGKNLYNVDNATSYALALLDIHTQYWEVASSENLRRYHRSLQYEVEVCFHFNKAMKVHKTPPFLSSWLARSIFKVKHNSEGRRKMLQILNDIPAVIRNKLETGDLQSDGIISNPLCFRKTFRSESIIDWKAIVANRHHQKELKQMIGDICAEKRILQHGKTKYSWRLTIFHTIRCDDGKASTAVVQYSFPSFCLLYQHEIAAVVASGSGGESKGGFQWDKAFMDSSSLPKMILNVPFRRDQAVRMLTGEWFDDEIINAYLLLCGYFQPDIKFLATQWGDKLRQWGDEAEKRTIKWVS
jgi:hypothetical protein